MCTEADQLRRYLDGTRLCLHLAPPCDYNAAAAKISSACRERRRSLAIAQLPRPQFFRFRLLRRPNVFDWLSAKANVSLETAKQITQELPVRVHPDVRRNAMNAMRFLGLAAAILENTDVLLYEVSGMDPIGRSMIHKYARKHYKGSCLLHVCWVPLSSDCPNLGECRAITLQDPNTT